MPAPVVYVLAIVGTVGAALAFKEFVYEPHIAPAIDRWKTEYQIAREARRRRQAAAVPQDLGNLPMSETQRNSTGRPNDKYSDDESSDDEDNQPLGKRAFTTSHRFMRDGLLIKRPIAPAKNPVDVELDNLVAREVNEWRNEATGQVLRQRKNVSEYAMDESIQPIPYTPLSPSRTHVIFDSSAPSPATLSTYSQLSSPPQVRAPSPAAIKHAELSIHGESKKSSSPVYEESVNPPARAAPSPSLPSPPTSPEFHAGFRPNADVGSVSSPPSELSSFHRSTPSQRTPEPRASHASSSSTPVYVPTHPLQHSYPQIVPSLSQSYPQELDYEHDLELLSPPSSRSESPFSMAALSPEQGGRVLSPYGNRPASGISSPLRMNLGNQSYDAISPIPPIQALSPFLDPPTDHSTATYSGQSTAYLSFADDSSDNDSDFAQPYAHIGTGSGLLGSTAMHAQSPPPPQLLYQRPPVLHPSLLQGPYNTSPAPRDTTRLASTTRTASTPGPGLFPVSPRVPRTPAPTPGSASHTANAAVSVGAGGGDPAYFRPSSATGYLSESVSASGTSFRTAHGGTSTPTPSDSELSDLDFVSDYAISESDLGDESDASWSIPAARAQGRA